MVRVTKKELKKIIKNWQLKKLIQGIYTFLDLVNGQPIANEKLI
jgi:hypothetical protein